MWFQNEDYWMLKLVLERFDDCSLRLMIGEWWLCKLCMFISRIRTWFLFENFSTQLRAQLLPVLRIMDLLLQRWSSLGMVSMGQNADDSWVYRFSYVYLGLERIKIEQHMYFGSLVYKLGISLFTSVFYVLLSGVVYVFCWHHQSRLPIGRSSSCFPSLLRWQLVPNSWCLSTGGVQRFRSFWGSDSDRAWRRPWW